jgi:transcriptional regulator with XRE-family HTH domain
MLDKVDKHTGLSRFGYPLYMPSEQLALIDMPKKETMGTRIRRLRERANLTQDQLARRCGVNKSAVSQWEMGSSENIKLQPFLRLLRTLDVTHEYLLWGSEKAPAGFYLDEAAAEAESEAREQKSGNGN